MITYKEDLRPKLTELLNTILKMCNQIYKRRPTCAELLSEYKKWGIDGKEIKIFFNIKMSLDQVQNKNIKFFNNFLKIKLNYPREVQVPVKVTGNFLDFIPEKDYNL